MTQRNWNKPSSSNFSTEITAFSTYVAYILIFISEFKSVFQNKITFKEEFIFQDTLVFYIPAINLHC